MKLRKSVLYLAHDGYDGYDLYFSEASAKKQARAKRRYVQDDRVAGLCDATMNKVFGNRLAKKHIIKMEVTLTEEKI